jgi:hypothetical protein
MLGWLVRRIRGSASGVVSVDPRKFGDPLALKTGWGAVKRGGADWRTHRLVEVDSFRVEFRPSRVISTFFLSWLTAGVALIVAYLVPALTGSEPWDSAPSLYRLAWGVVAAVVGGAALYSLSPITFDKRRGAYWKKRVGPYESETLQRLRHPTRLDRIHALQLVSETCKLEDSNRSYESHELNLIMTDATRVNIVDHWDLDGLRDDANALGSFLGRPLWDATW